MIARALEIDPESPRALALQAFVTGFRDWDFKTAMNLSQQVISIAPGDAEAHHFAAGLVSVSGQFESALAESRIAAPLNPLYPPLLEGIGHRLRHLWRFEEAIEIYEQSIRNGFDRVYGNLYFAYAEQGRIEDAANAIMQHNDPHELDNQDHMFLAYFSGDHEEAARIYKEYFLEPVYNLYPDAGDAPWIPIMNAAIAEREKQD